MKKNYIHTTCTLVLLGAMAAGLWGCQKDDLAEQATAQVALQLTVIDGGYTTGQALNYEGGTLGELPQTRATENGYKTTFAAGDQIGLYAVKSGALAATNVCLTLTNVSGTLQWKTDVKLPTGADRYFAYYPYKPSPGNVTTAATDAEAFFAGIISAWTPAIDQSGTKYTAQDLMVGGNTLSSNKLTITLAHKMGLAVIKLPGSATDAKFNGFTPYSGVSGEYRYLLKPNTETTLEGSFIDVGELRGFAIAANIAGGKYKKYTVDPQPQIGDYYYDNKTYSTTYDTKGGTRTCIGIIFYLTADGKHGKIVSLDEIYGLWGVAVKNESTDVTGIRSEDDGALATKNLIAARRSSSSFATDYVTFNWIYATKNSNNVDGSWYLPAVNELLALYAAWNGDSSTTENKTARDTFNSKLTTAIGTGISAYEYRSSTERAMNTTNTVAFKDGKKGEGLKSSSRYVRGILAF